MIVGEFKRLKTDETVDAVDEIDVVDVQHRMD